MLLLFDWITVTLFPQCGIPKKQANSSRDFQHSEKEEFKMQKFEKLIFMTAVLTMVFGGAYAKEEGKSKSPGM
jgi:hypothetical protein